MTLSGLAALGVLVAWLVVIGFVAGAALGTVVSACALPYHSLSPR